MRKVVKKFELPRPRRFVGPMTYKGHLWVEVLSDCGSDWLCRAGKARTKVSPWYRGLDRYPPCNRTWTLCGGSNG